MADLSWQTSLWRPGPRRTQLLRLDPGQFGGLPVQFDRTLQHRSELLGRVEHGRQRARIHVALLERRIGRDLGDAGLRDGDRALGLVDLVVAVAFALSLFLVAQAWRYGRDYGSSPGAREHAYAETNEIGARARDLAAQGRTVLVSSHQLAEMQHSVDDVLVIDHGRLLAQGPLDDVTQGRSLEEAFLQIVGAGA